MGLAFEPDMLTERWLEMALALSLPAELDDCWSIQAIAFDVVLCELFVQSPANALRLRYIFGNQASPR